MKSIKSKKILLIMPPFWDPICPPQGIVCLKSYLEKMKYKVHICDFNTDGYLFNLQRKYFDLGIRCFPHWKFLNIFRNGPRYFTRHQLAWFFGRDNVTQYRELVSLILNFDGKSICTDQMIAEFNIILQEIFGLVESNTKRLLNCIKPDVIGCTMFESTFPLALAILKTAKKINHKITTVLGGPGVILGNTLADGNLERVIKKCNWVDAILFGEGEGLLENYLGHSFGDKRIVTTRDLKDTSCHRFFSEDGLIDINKIPIANYDSSFAAEYFWLSIFTSRGCPFKCTFCFENRFWIRFRQKNPVKIAAEMQILSSHYRKNKFYLCDSISNYIATGLSKEIIAKKREYYWDCYMRISPECLDTERVNLWAAAGLRRVRIGIESGSTRILKLMNKDISLLQAEMSLKNFASRGILTSTLWIAGFPGEHKNDFRESLIFFEKNHKFIYQADIWEYVDISSRNNVYPQEFEDILFIKYSDCEGGLPSAERFERISQFEKLRIKLGVPNPYSARELIEAQQRWVTLGHRKDATFF